MSAKKLSKILEEMQKLDFSNCKDLIQYLNINKDDILKARQDNKTTLLHVLATDPKSISVFACSVVDCEKIEKTINCLNTIIVSNEKSLDDFFKLMKEIIDNLNANDKKAKDIAGTRKEPIKGQLLNIFNHIEKLDNHSKHTTNSTKNPSVTSSNVVSSTNVVSQRLDKKDSSNVELSTLITNIMKGLGKPIDIKQPTKGGAPDDALATLIVRVLKSIGEKSEQEMEQGTEQGVSSSDSQGQAPAKDSTSFFSSISNPFKSSLTGTGTGTGTEKAAGEGTLTETGTEEKKSLLVRLPNLPNLPKFSMPSISFSKKDDIDTLLNDVIDIILNIANNEPLPISSKDKLLSGLNKLSGLFPTFETGTEETEKYVPVSNTKCKVSDKNPIAMYEDKCLYDKDDEDQKMSKQ